MLGLAVCSRYKPVLSIIRVGIYSEYISAQVTFSNLYYLAVTIVLIIIADSRLVVNI